MKKAAAFRGGEHLGGEPESIYMPVKWKCAFGLYVQLIRKRCAPRRALAPGMHETHLGLSQNCTKKSILPQVWNPQHSPDETYEIPMRFSAYEIKEASEKKLGL